jgi:cytoskeletal protein CcmA (bactofilin family)
MAIVAKDDSGARAAARTSNETTLSIISAGSTITGDIACTGVLKVEGQIDGSVRQARQVMLAKDGAIRGDVTAHEIVVGGVVDGNVTAADRLELQPTAVVNGDIATKSIVVMEGARINGTVKMTELALVNRSADGRDVRATR